MTPAINLAKKSGIPYQVHQYQHDPKAESYGEEAAQLLGIDARQVFKTLVAEVDQMPVVAVLPVAHTLNLKQLARAHGGKKAKMADKQKAQTATGYVLGGVSPLGQKQRLPLYLDESAKNFATIFVSGGKRGLEIELAGNDLLSLTSGKQAKLTVLS